MTTDERIEALTQSVELLALMHQDIEKKWDERLGKMLDIVERLDTIVENHEKRLGGLEG